MITGRNTPTTTVKETKEENISKPKSPPFYVQEAANYVALYKKISAAELEKFVKLHLRTSNHPRKVEDSISIIHYLSPEEKNRDLALALIHIVCDTTARSRKLRKDEKTSLLNLQATLQGNIYPLSEDHMKLFYEWQDARRLNTLNTYYKNITARAHTFLKNKQDNYDITGFIELMRRTYEVTQDAMLIRAMNDAFFSFPEIIDHLPVKDWFNLHRLGLRITEQQTSTKNEEHKKSLAISLQEQKSLTIEIDLEKTKNTREAQKNDQPSSHFTTSTHSLFKSASSSTSTTPTNTKPEANQTKRRSSF